MLQKFSRLNKKKSTSSSVNINVIEHSNRDYRALNTIRSGLTCQRVQKMLDMILLRIVHHQVLSVHL